MILKLKTQNFEVSRAAQRSVKRDLVERGRDHSRFLTRTRDVSARVDVHGSHEMAITGCGGARDAQLHTRRSEIRFIDS
jgi:hypothetical protein